jgi:hypothetical protein
MTEVEGTSPLCRTTIRDTVTEFDDGSPFETIFDVFILPLPSEYLRSTLNAIPDFLSKTRLSVSVRGVDKV